MIRMLFSIVHGANSCSVALPWRVRGCGQAQPLSRLNSNPRYNSTTGACGKLLLVRIIWLAGRGLRLNSAQSHGRARTQGVRETACLLQVHLLDKGESFLFRSPLYVAV